ALREYGVIGDAGRTDLPRLAKLDDRFAENWHGPAEPLAWPVVFVCGELVHENETVARIEFAVRSFAAWRFRDDVGHARRGAAEVMRQIRCPAARDGIPRVDGVAAFVEHACEVGAARDRPIALSPAPQQLWIARTAGHQLVIILF